VLFRSLKFAMKYQLILTALAAAGVQAQKAKSKCQTVKEILSKPPPDPLVPFTPGSADFPCNMGAAIPFGKVPTGCADLEIIVARGTSEPGQFGMVVGDPLVARVKRDMAKLNVRGYPVQYPASTGGAQTGIADIPKRIAAQVAACPNEKFALVGYSQGGMVVSGALKQIPAKYHDKVVAVVLYGAGDGSKTNKAYYDRVLANCAPGDFACPNAGKGPGHVSYNNKGTIWHDRSAQYIMSAYNGKSQGHLTMRKDN